MPVWKRNLGAVALANFVTMLGMSAFLPFFPDILREIGGLSPAEEKIWTGLLTAGAPLPAAFMGPIWGALGDRYGRKVMITRALGAIAIFVGLMGLVASPYARALPVVGALCATPWPLLFLRVAQGTFSGFVAPALTLVTVDAPPGRQGRVIAVAQSSIVLGAALGPVIGGWIAESMAPHLTFFWCAGVAVVATVIVAALAREVPFEAARTRPLEALRVAAADARTSFGDRALVALLVGMFLSQTAATLTNPLVRLHVELFPGIPAASLPSAAGYAFTASALGQVMFAPLWSLYADRADTRRLLPLVTLVTAAVVVPQGLVHSVRVFWGLRFLQGAAAAVAIPMAYAHATRLSPAGKRGTAYGLTLSAFQLANVVAPAGAGFLAAAFGTQPLFFVSAVILALASLWLHRRL